MNDEQGIQISNLFLKYRTGRLTKSDNRTAFNAILWIARSGTVWRDLHEERYGSWKTMCTHFCNWIDSELLVGIFQYLYVEPVFETISIDSTSVKAHQHSAGTKKISLNKVNQHIGISRGGNTTKIYALMDGLGNPIRFLLTSGQSHDAVPTIHC